MGNSASTDRLEERERRITRGENGAALDGGEDKRADLSGRALDHRNGNCKLQFLQTVRARLQF